jgi:hypothetical protein
MPTQRATPLEGSIAFALVWTEGSVRAALTIATRGQTDALETRPLLAAAAAATTARRLRHDGRQEPT